MKPQKQYQSFSDISLSPSESIKRYIVQLSKECTEHLSNSLSNNNEMYAFSMKVWAFSIMLESYTPDKIKPLTRDHYKELDEKIKDIRDSELNEDNKKKNIVLTRFNYGLPIFEQSIRIMQNSRIVEVEVEGVIDLKRDGFKERVRTLDKAQDITITNTSGEEPT